jgi:hypothetical protein
MRIGAVQPPGATPERTSKPVKVTVTGVVFQPDAFGGGATALETTGDVISMLMPVALTDGLTLPALSVQVPLVEL